jgi:hypothetical protein
MDLIWNNFIKFYVNTEVMCGETARYYVILHANPVMFLSQFVILLCNFHTKQFIPMENLLFTLH